ncbi:hypothetical protein V8F20_009485 [Naviculisporaceae sp. PSN 640]
MQLRNVARTQRPGRYREYTGLTGPERPTFVHDDPTFDAEVAVHCAFPSLDMHYPGPGPSEVWKARRKLEEEAAKHPVVVFDCDREDSDQEDTEYPEDNDQPRDIDNIDQDDDDDDDDGGDNSEEESVSFPQCSPPTNAVPHRLILTIKDMSKAPGGSTGTEPYLRHQLQQHTTLDKNGDTIMVSPAFENRARHGRPRNPRRLTVTVTKRPKSPDPLPHETKRPGELRPARTVSLGQRPRRKSVLDDRNGVNGSFDSPDIVQPPVGEDSWVTDIFNPHTNWPGPSYTFEDSDEEEETRITEPFQTYTNWSDLSDGVKYLIFYDLTQKGQSFVRACRMLSLDFGESKDMIDMIVKQRVKIAKARDRAAQADNFNDPDWLDRFLSEPCDELVTASLTDDDIRQGKSFLKFMGLQDVAANLDYYQQSCMEGRSEEYDIPLNHFHKDGHQQLIPHFLVGCQEELKGIFFDWKKKQQRQAMSDGELHVRMDAPPGTVNPREVEQLKGIERWQDFDAKDMEEGLPLHPDNFLMILSNDRHLDVRDNSVKTEQERQRRRAAQGIEALDARYEWFSGPAPQRFPRDRFPLFNQLQRLKEQMGPGQRPRIEDMIPQLIWDNSQAAPTLADREQPGFRPAAQRFAPDVSGMGAHIRNGQQPGLVNRTQHPQPNVQVPLGSEERAEALVDRNQPSRPNAQAHSSEFRTGPVVPKAQPLRPTAQIPVSNPRIKPMEPYQRLNLGLDSVLNRPRDRLKEPKNKTRVSVGRRSQSADVEVDEVEEEPISASARKKNRKKKIQFEDDSYDEEEYSPRKKKKSPEKKARREASHPDTPRSEGSRPRGTPTSRVSLVEDPSPVLPRKSRDVAQANSFTEDPHDGPSQTNARQVGGNTVAHQDDLRPRPNKRTDQSDSATSKPAKKRITNNKSAINLVPAQDYSYNRAPGREGTRPETTDFRPSSNPEARRNSSLPEPSETSESGLGDALPEERDSKPTQGPDHGNPMPATAIPSRAGQEDQIARANGHSQPAQSTSSRDDRARQQSAARHPQAFFALKSPPVPRNGGGGATVQKTISSFLPMDTHQTAPIPNGNVVEQQSGSEYRESPAAAAPMPPNNLQTVKDTPAPQRGSRSEIPQPAPEALSLGQKVRKGDMKTNQQGQELNKPLEPNHDKPPKKARTQRKRESAPKVVTGSEDAAGPQPVPFNRQSTTPIPLPNIPGTHMRPPLPRVPDIRNPQSYASGSSLSGPSQPRTESQNVNSSASGMRSVSREIMSEAQIRRLGSKRAESEIFRNRERAKSAAASSKSSGSSNPSGSSPQSATPKKSEVPSAGNIGAPGIGPSSSQYTSQAPTISRETHGPNSQTPISSHAITGAQYQSHSINRNSPASVNMGLPPGTSRAAIASNDRSNPQFSTMPPRPTGNIAQTQASPGRPIRNGNGATNSVPLPGRAGLGLQTRGIVSPMSNLSGNFGRGQTSNYIQAQDDSINRAFGQAREATSGLPMPDRANGNGGRGIRRGLVPGPTAGPNALVEQYHSNLTKALQGGKMALGSRASMGGAGAGPGPSQGMSSVGFPASVPSSAGPGATNQGASVGSPSIANMNHNRVLNIGPRQEIWSPAQRAKFRQAVEARQRQGQFLEPPPQFTGFRVPPHRLTDKVTGQQQPGGAFQPQMTMSASSHERTQAQTLPQSQGFSVGNHQNSPPGPNPMSLRGNPGQVPANVPSSMSPPRNTLQNPMNIMNNQPAFMGGTSNGFVVPGFENQQGMNLGHGGYQFQYPGQVQGQNAQQQGLRTSPQQGHQGISLVPSQSTGQGQGQGHQQGPPTSTQNMGTDTNMGLGTDSSGGAGASAGLEDIAIDPRILGDMSEMDFSTMMSLE